MAHLCGRAIDMLVVLQSSVVNHHHHACRAYGLPLAESRLQSHLRERAVMASSIAN